MLAGARRRGAPVANAHVDEYKSVVAKRIPDCSKPRPLRRASRRRLLKNRSRVLGDHARQGGCALEVERYIDTNGTTDAQRRRRDRERGDAAPFATARVCAQKATGSGRSSRKFLFRDGRLLPARNLGRE